MANMNIRVHRATGARLDSHCRHNARHISLVVTRKEADGGDVELSIFDLPDEVVGKLIDAFGAPRRYDFENDAVYPEDVDRLKRRVAELEAQLREHPISTTNALVALLPE